MRAIRGVRLSSRSLWLGAAAAATAVGGAALMQYQHSAPQSSTSPAGGKATDASIRQMHHTPSVFSNVTSPPASILEVTSEADLNTLVKTKAIILMCRGHRAAEVQAAREAFVAATKQIVASNETAARALQFAVISDDTPPKQAEAFVSRIGITYDQPFVLILDNFLDSETKFLSKETGVPTTASVVALVGAFLDGRLDPVVLGQPRPPHDRCEHCSAMYEIVTDSFASLVLDPGYDVLVEGYTPRCDACKAFAHRYRMFAVLCQRHLPQLRVARMNILDNDRPVKYMPEKWTPSLRFFAATTDESSSTAEHTSPSARGGDSEEEAIPVPAKPSTLLNYEMLLPPGAAPVAETSAVGPGSDGAAPTKIVLPTLPELTQFVIAHARHQPADAAELLRDAELLEEEADIIEKAYSQVLDYMQLWAAYNDAINALPAEELYHTTPASASATVDANAAVGAAVVRADIPSTSAAEKRVAKQFQQSIIAAHKYIVSEASAGSAERVLLLLGVIARTVASKHIVERIHATYESSESDATAAPPSSERDVSNLSSPTGSSAFPPSVRSDGGMLLVEPLVDGSSTVHSVSDSAPVNGASHSASEVGGDAPPPPLNLEATSSVPVPTPNASTGSS